MSGPVVRDCFVPRLGHGGRTSLKPIVTVVSLLLAAGIALGAGADQTPPAKFAVPPTAERAGDAVKISFTVDRATDVAVYILDAKGKVVCHLAAGVLGDKAPAPLQAGSLAQTLTWDGKDDDGKPAEGGPFKVRVGLGLKPQFDSYLLHNPDSVPGVIDVAAAPGGELCVFYRDYVGNPNMGGVKVKVFGRDGHYRRTLMPFSGSLPFDRVSAFETMRDDDGRLVPKIFSWASLRIYPSVIGAGRGRAIASSPAVDSRGAVHWLLHGGALTSVATDGGPAHKTFLSKPVFDDALDLSITNPICKTDATLAVGQDDRFLYVCSLFVGSAKNVKPFPCVYRLDLQARGPAELFAGDRAKAGKTGKLLTAPVGVACGGGVVYVSDSGAGRVVGFRSTADGTVQGAEWMRFGYAPYSAKWVGGKPFCCCENASFDVDDFGRVFYPNLGQFRVEMVDTNNNWLGTFGRYGNLDDQAAGGDIPMAWPTYLTVSDKYVYVTDLISLRIVRVKLDYAADQTCDIK